jgi:hypothetical protein
MQHWSLGMRLFDVAKMLLLFLITNNWYIVSWGGKMDGLEKFGS